MAESAPLPAVIMETKLADALLDPLTYTSDPFGLYGELRSSAPVSFCQPGGFWVVATHPEIVSMGTDPETFCSSRGILVEEIGAHYDSPPTMMHTDPPEHTRYRRLVQPGFRPTVVREIEPRIKQLAQEIVGVLDAGTAVDIVRAVSVPFPLQVICEILGVEAVRWPQFFEWSEAVIPGATDWPAERRQALMGEMVSYLVGLAKERRRERRDDVVSALASSADDTGKLSDDELAMFLVQLLVAGNETTRNLLSSGLIALAEAPEQWERLHQEPDLIPLAVEELLRWTTPVISFMRTTTRPTKLRNVPIPANAPILMLYASANRDEGVFGESANELDVGRQPNPHVAFGFGPHFCLGAA